MNNINKDRRSFIKGSIVTAVALVSTPNVLHAETSTKKVVVVGGGVGGSTVARYLRKFIPQTTLLEITIIEPKTTYTTPFGTNEMISGSRTLAELTVGYDALKTDISGEIVHKKAIGINSMAKYVSIEDGTQYLYDFCIVATGIDFEYSDIVGLNAQTNAKVPHAYNLVNDGSTEQMTE
ncbi:MAG: Unknown protein, partial [uncultured Sulfurovum sp.]